MERIRISQLRPGQALPQHLFSLGGQKLLSEGTQLTERHLQTLQRYGQLEAILAGSVHELVSEGVLKSVDDRKLAVGQRVSSRLTTSQGQVLVEAGEKLEEHHLDAMRAGGGVYASAAPDSSDDKQSRRERLLLGEALVEQMELEAVTINRRVDPAQTPVWTPAPDAPAWPAPEALASFRAEHVNLLRQLFARVEAGLDVGVDQFQRVVDELLPWLANHPHRFTQLALLCPRREDYLPDHAYTVAVLAMAIGAQLKWPREHVKLLGLAGLLYDLGMLLVPERIRSGAEQLTEVDRGRVQRHPLYTLTLLEHVPGVPLVVRLAAYQHHERENGSGYPKGIRRDQICDHARVLAVADSFSAATEPRSYRKPKLPYIAMEETLRATSTLLFWKPAARALVQAAGLFPVGSYVKLSDSTNAHVVSANPVAMDRPAVQPLNGQGAPKGDVIDLATVDKRALSVVRPIPGPQG